MTRPTDDYLWAESASPGDIDNPTVKRSGGYLFENELPHNQFNYLLRSPGRWIDYLRYQGDGRATLQSAITNAGAGELTRVEPDISNDYKGRIQGTLGGNAVITQDTDGVSLYIATRNAGVYAVQRVLISTWTVTHTYTLLSTPDDTNPVRCISCDGKHLAVGHGGRLEVFDVDTNTRVLDVNLDVLGDALDVHVHGASVITLWRGGGAGSSFIQLHELSTYTSLGITFVLLPNTTGDGAITCDGRRVYLAHTTSTANETKLSAFDINPSGGALPELFSLTWMNDLVQHRAIETNGDYIAVGVEGVTNQVRVYRVKQLASNDVELENVTNLGSTECHSIVFTHNLMIAASTSASLVDMTAYELGSFEIVWRDSQVSEVPIGLGRTELCTDGLHVYVPSGTLAQRIAQITIGRHVTTWLRCDPTAQYRRPYYNLAIPAEL